MKWMDGHLKSESLASEDERMTGVEGDREVISVDGLICKIDTFQVI